MNLFRKHKYGISKLVAEQKLYAVKVGNCWVKDNRFSYGFETLTKDFRMAIVFSEAIPGEFPPPLHSLKGAFRAAEEYGGKVVRLTVSMEEVEEVNS